MGVGLLRAPSGWNSISQDWNSMSLQTPRLGRTTLVGEVVLGNSHSSSLGFECRLGPLISCAMWGSSLPFLLPGASRAKRMTEALILIMLCTSSMELLCS